MTMTEVRRAIKVLAIFFTTTMWTYMNLVVVLYFHETSESTIGLIALLLLFIISSITGGKLLFSTIDRKSNPRESGEEKE